MHRVQLGNTNLEISRFVLGCAPLAGLFEPVSAEQAELTLAAAWDAGIRTFDTAPHYGVGLSEERLGAFLRDKPRTEFTVSTKVGRLLVETDENVDGAEGFFGTPQRRRVRDYSRDGVRRSLEESCARLGLDHIDIALIHDPDDYWEPAINEAYPALEELRSQGAVTAIGAGMIQNEMLTRFVQETDIDCLLIAGRYSLLDLSSADSLFPAAQAAGIGVLVGGVYKSGILADPREGATSDYAPASPELLGRVRSIQAICARHGVSLATAAVQFVLRHPAVSAVVLGARSPEEVIEDVAQEEATAPPELFAELEASDLLGV